MTKRTPIRYLLVIILSVALIYTVVSAATTISDSISTGGTLSATGATTLSSTLGVSGLATLTGGFDSAASSTVDQRLAVQELYVYGNASTTGTLTVTGASTLTGAVTMTGGFDSAASSTVDQRLAVQELYVYGNATTTGAATTTLNAAFLQGFYSAASSTVAGNLTVTGTFSPTDFNPTGDANIGDSLLVAGNATTTGAATTTLNAAFLQGFHSAASSTVDGALTVTGVSTLQSTLILTGLATLTGGFDSAASSTVDERLAVQEFYVYGNASTTGSITVASASSTEAWINASTTVKELSVDGNFILLASESSAADAATTTEPTEACDSTVYGRLIVVEEIDDVNDAWLWFCGQSAAGTYAWKLIDNNN
ncbi:hypothetical protein KKD19_04715 [Patescibacteria group bacterium]|nr:hypothetical protein [Patescibacteria group bacterium]MBU4512511.1 hypothetical protein [Patescibacteria group bacterium]MCG2693510.1 hypothetical protein [Candidatus Parcubacteria bacterium]